MFGRLTSRLQKSLEQFARKTFTEQNMAQTLKEIRNALLEADVAFTVVDPFIQSVQDEAKGQSIEKHLSPSQALVKIVNDKLTALMGEANAPLALNTQPPAVILMAGLQGSGKTTSSAKLAKLLIEEGKKVYTVSCDVYRPAAMEQLHSVSDQVGATYIEADPKDTPENIARQALDKARLAQADVLIVDTAGRLHIDADMMGEIKVLHQAVKPIETLFVVDGMTGQDAAQTAKAFHEALPLTGVVVTKLDGDARGGAILSIRQITGKPVKFIGVGEKMEALERFHPERMASRILGMGDMLSLIEEMEKKIDRTQAEKLAKKIEKGKGFDLEDFRNQLIQMNNMGGLGGLMDKLPGMSQIPDAVKAQANDGVTRKMLAIINSMTPKERRFPAIIKGSRKKRIALGSGTEIQDVNRLLKQFTQMQKMMKRMAGGGMNKMMRQMKNMLPPNTFS
ncbi:MAG: signal recognition particle protein [Legionellales bacterium]|nr:signal recognition particle protein [Legionellales bacterium]